MLLWMDSTPYTWERLEHIFSVLPLEEQTRLLKIKPMDKRMESTCGWLLCVYGVSKETGIPPRSLCFEREEGGKPKLLLPKDSWFNISHSKGYVACVVGCCPVSVDIQKIDGTHSGVAQRYFTKRQQEWLAQSKSPQEDFALLWTIREGYAKLKGEAIYRHLQDELVEFINREPVLLEKEITYYAYGEPKGYQMSVFYKEKREKETPRQVFLEQMEAYFGQ